MPPSFTHLFCLNGAFGAEKFFALAAVAKPKPATSRKAANKRMDHSLSNPPHAKYIRRHRFFVGNMPPGPAGSCSHSIDWYNGIVQSLARHRTMKKSTPGAPNGVLPD